jgi:hypothetical protein
MAKVRNISNDTLVVPLLGGVAVEPDQVVDVPDKHLEDYDWPESTWAVVAAAKTVSTSKDKE